MLKNTNYFFLISTFFFLILPISIRHDKNDPVGQCFKCQFKYPIYSGLPSGRGKTARHQVQAVPREEQHQEEEGGGGAETGAGEAQQTLQDLQQTEVHDSQAEGILFEKSPGKQVWMCRYEETRRSRPTISRYKDGD